MNRIYIKSKGEWQWEKTEHFLKHKEKHSNNKEAYTDG